VKIVTDCAADLSPEDIETMGVCVAPLYIQFTDAEVNSTDLTPDEFYSRMENMAPEIPTTAQPSSGMFEALYRPFHEAGESIMSLHISSGLSGTIHSAQVAANNLPQADITLVDTKTLSGGERFQVIAAALGAKAGWAKNAILHQIDQIRLKTEVIYTLETLEYLERGGRIGRVQALAGSLLKIKPVISVDKTDGKYSNVGKGRTIDKTIKLIADYLVRQYGVETPMRATVLHGQFIEKAESMAQILKNNLNVAKLEIMRISPVLGVHTGPGVVGVAAVPISLLDEII
jgi:DegV family protein with EDD domain